VLTGLKEAGYDVATRNHAEAILAHDFALEIQQLVACLTDFRISMSELVTGGGGESGQTQRLRHALSAIGWKKHNFAVQVIVDGVTREGVSHEVDHVLKARAGALALEIEWNNKDPFFDRDLENFQRLHALSAISLGVIVTRGRTMQDQMLDRVTAWLDAEGLHTEDDLDRLDLGARTHAQKRAVAGQVARGVPFSEAFARKFVADKFGPASTHWAKLEDRVNRGVGNPCPLLLIGLPASILTDGPAVKAAPDLFGGDG
jgi:hypothetical protein